jgi:hypothetical protein
MALVRRLNIEIRRFISIALRSNRLLSARADFRRVDGHTHDSRGGCVASGPHLHRASPKLEIRPPKLALAALLHAVACGAVAEGPQDRYWAELSYFYPTISSMARLDSRRTDVPGTVISLEDDLGLVGRKGTPYVQLGMRLGERWRVEFEYYSLERAAPSTIQRQITWGDAEFHASAQLDSRFDSTVYRLSGGYSLYRTFQSEAGVSFGLHMTDFTLEVSGEGNGSNGFALLSERRHQFVPLPTMGLYGSYKFAERWSARGRVDYMSLSYDRYDGSLVNWLAAIEWRFAKHWGAGLGYRHVDYKLESWTPDLRGRVNYKFNGPAIFVYAAF